jgi:hypothetical protein
MSLQDFVLAAMLQLAPGRDHTETATVIARVVLAERPLFAYDEARRKTAALVVAVAFRESSFRNDVVSETRDYCLVQIHGRPDLAQDVDACVRVGITMLRESMRMCPVHPIAFYASGPGGCTNARAQRISRDRVTLARRLAP